MLSIGAGAQQQVMAFIEQLGVRNVIVEVRETTDPQAFGKVRSSSPDLTFQDYRVIRATMEGVMPRRRANVSCRRRCCRSRTAIC